MTNGTSWADSVESHLEDVRAQIDAVGAAFLTFRSFGEETLVWRVFTSGTCRNWAAMSGEPGPAGFDTDHAESMVDIRKGQWCLRCPAERHENRFAWLDEDIAHMCRWRETAAFETLHRPNGYQAQIRTILVHEERILGWCAFFFDQVRNRERVESILERSLPRWRSLGLNDLTVNSEPHFMVVNDNGDPIAANHHTVPAGDSGDLREVAKQAAERQVPGAADRWRSGRFEAVSRELSGLYGRVLLIVARPLETPQVDRTYALTCTQHQIVELFVDGASTGDIATALKLSQSTVKYHLRNVYDVLRVSGRLELAKLVHKIECDPLWAS